MVLKNSVSIESGSGLFPDGAKPLPDPMAMNYQIGIMVFSWGNLTGNDRDIYSWCEYDSNLRLQPRLSGADEFMVSVYS